MKISIINQQKDLAVSKPAARAAIKALFDFLKIDTDEISIHFVSQKKICLLHKDFFDDPTPTDCISFPLDGKTPKKGIPHHVLGEVFICPHTAVSYAKERGKDRYEELSLYLIHGLLHLIGYEDDSPEKRKKMRAAEKKCLNLLHSTQQLLKGKNL